MVLGLFDLIRGGTYSNKFKNCCMLPLPVTVIIINIQWWSCIHGLMYVNQNE